MKPDPQMPVKVRALLAHLQKNRPHIYRGLVTRFTAPAEMRGFFDFVGTIASKTVDAVTNFANSNGFDKIATAAAPFLANKAEKSALEIEIKRVNSGLPPKPTVPANATLPSTAVLPGAPMATGIAAWPMWAKVAGGVAGAGALWLLVSTLTRRR